MTTSLNLWRRSRPSPTGLRRQVCIAVQIRYEPDPFLNYRLRLEYVGRGLARIGRCRRLGGTSIICRRRDQMEARLGLLEGPLQRRGPDIAYCS